MGKRVLILITLFSLCCMTGAWPRQVVRSERGAASLDAGPASLQLAVSNGSAGREIVRPTARTGDAAPASDLIPGGLIPIDPPIAARITIGEAEIDGMATISGTAGAVAPSTPVYIAGLDTGHITSTMSLDDGSFQVRFFAPPGAWIQVKHGTEEIRDPPIVGGEQDTAWLNVIPGTIVQVPLSGGDDPAGSPFALAGAVEIGQHGEWMLEGTILAQSAGLTTTLMVTGTLRVTSPLITSSTTLDDSSAQGIISLCRFFDDGGRRVPFHSVFASTFQTPTGLPISREVSKQSPLEGAIQVTGWHYLGNGVMEATLTSALEIPPGLSAGYYRPRLRLMFSGVPVGPERSFTRMGVRYSHFLPVMRVGMPGAPRLIWTLLSNTLGQATRGTVARENKGQFGLIPHIITQADAFILSRLDPHTGEPIAYRLEPYLPLVSVGDRGIPGQPSIPFRFPSGSLEVAVERPDGVMETMGPMPFLQSTNRSPSNRQGKVYDEGGGRIDDPYQLTTLDDAFAYTFPMDGHYVITMTGTVEDIWGHEYDGQGTYDVHVARSLKVESGQLPTTPYEVGDAFSAGVQVYPPVPAFVEVRLIHMPYSDPAQMEEQFFSGLANRYGYFQPVPDTAYIFTKPGEYRVDITALHEAEDGTLWMGSATWGNVVERPGTPLVAHGRRGRDLIPPWDQQWFFTDTLTAGTAVHAMYPYWSGDVLWGHEPDTQYGGDAIIPAVTVDDTAGQIQSIIEARWHDRAHSELSEGLDFTGRVANKELPLFSTTETGEDLFWAPDRIDQYGYAYRSSERPDVRVHETVSEDSLGISYWRFIAEFGAQAGFEGDRPNDLKWEFGGAVYRVLSETNLIDEYAIYGSLWVLTPDNDPIGLRVAPPFQGAAGGIDGGPIMRLKGEPIDLLFLPRGVQPGDVLEIGDTFSFAGHVGPPLDSHVAVTVTAPSATSWTIAGQASKIGWFYDPATEFPVEEPGLWTVEVHVVQQDAIPSGGVPLDHNTGSVLGSADGQYHFYVVDHASPRLGVAAPPPGYLDWPTDPLTQEPITVTTVPIVVTVPGDLGNPVLSYTIRMPGFILAEGTMVPAGGEAVIPFDPIALHADYPNLDLKAKDANVPGLSDPIWIGFLLSGERGGEPVHQAGALFLDGDQVMLPGGNVPNWPVYLPAVLRGSGSGP